MSALIETFGRLEFDGGDGSFLMIERYPDGTFQVVVADSSGSPAMSVAIDSGEATALQTWIGRKQADDRTDAGPTSTGA